VRKGKRILALLPMVVVPLTSCSGGPQMSTDVMLACTMFKNPDEYRVLVLMNIGGGRTEPHAFIDSVVRDLNYPGVVETLEAKDLKDKFANALYLYADSLVQNDSNVKSFASSNLDKVAEELKLRCEDLGMNYSEITD
jgi:hypothetical protein